MRDISFKEDLSTFQNELDLDFSMFLITENPRVLLVDSVTMQASVRMPVYLCSGNMHSLEASSCS